MKTPSVRPVRCAIYTRVSRSNSHLSAKPIGADAGRWRVPHGEKRVCGPSELKATPANSKAGSLPPKKLSAFVSKSHISHVIHDVAIRSVSIFTLEILGSFRLHPSAPASSIGHRPEVFLSANRRAS